MDELAELLQATLDEETETDEKLTGLSDTVNDEAVSGSADDEGDDDEEPVAKPMATKKSR